MTKQNQEDEAMSDSKEVADTITLPNGVKITKAEMLESDIAHLRRTITSQQATITSLEASIELLEVDKACKRIIIDRARENLRKLKRRPTVAAYNALQEECDGRMVAIKKLQATITKLTAAPIKITVKSKDVWITFDAGEGRQSMLCLNNIINDMHNEGITKGICLDAIRAALKEKTDES